MLYHFESGRMSKSTTLGPDPEPEVPLPSPRASPSGARAGSGAAGAPPRVVVGNAVPERSWVGSAAGGLSGTASGLSGSLGGGASDLSRAPGGGPPGPCP